MRFSLVCALTRFICVSTDSEREGVGVARGHALATHPRGCARYDAQLGVDPRARSRAQPQVCLASNASLKPLTKPLSRARRDVN